MLKISIKYWQLVVFGGFLFLALLSSGCSLFDSQTTASQANAATAQGLWGKAPNITNFFEYNQDKKIYEARDNPKLVLNEYMEVPLTGQLICMGKVQGYGVPYGTQWSQPTAAGGSSVPEPNGLYPSQNTNADWTLPIDSKTGKPGLAFTEPNVIITSQDLPCTPLTGIGHD